VLGGSLDNSKIINHPLDKESIFSSKPK